jgi:succinate dehydrogenase/fumarate reductase cytochrome b subunit
MTLRDLHRASAFVIVAFAAMHITNHLASLIGVPAHIAFMETARTVYLHWAIESVLLSCVAFQVASGLQFVIRGWRQRKGLIPWLQAASGAYLAFFLIIHVGAVLYGRSVLQLDTNFYFAAAGFHVQPYQLFFAPYYFLAVVALFTHVACAVYWQLPSASVSTKGFMVGSSIVAGSIIALLIVLSLAGRLQPVEIPEEYKATYEAHAS